MEDDVNKFHKIQRNEIEWIRGIVLTDNLTRVPNGPSETKKETRTVLATNLGALLFNVAYFRDRI